ncbi:MAG: inositol monophosphatase [SAR86 cluster bacterium]|uniref:Inositol-1-monophosphatase n=1 Tax=SAR86 cluster bacterium TaxID=2030880 RepID=A0A2A4MT75_9GAMM|nr:MAG: inositol monophosphatase [SAR86 cluster bacterium]
MTTLSKTEISEILHFSKQLALETGALILAELDQLSSDLKHGNELVTSADLKADVLIRRRIEARFPKHCILSEESSPHLSQRSQISQLIKSPLWIIDPIDGTVNFAHGHPQSAVSIAFIDGGEVQTGVVFNPFSEELFYAQRGQGAFINDAAIEVGTQSELSRALIATGFPYDKSNLAPLIRRLQGVLEHCADIRRLGSAALDICWVAMGRLDGYYESLSVWDFAAAQLIATEAGASYGHFSQLPPGVSEAFYDQDILVANPHLYPKLLELLQKIDGTVT